MGTSEEKIAAARGQRSNGEAVASHDVEGMGPMDQTTETEDRGMPPHDLPSLPELEPNGIEFDPMLTLEYPEEKLAAVMTREDITRTMRMRAEEAEAVIVKSVNYQL